MRQKRGNFFVRPLMAAGAGSCRQFSSTEALSDEMKEKLTTALQKFAEDELKMDYSVVEAGLDVD